MNFIIAYLYYETIHEFSVKLRTSFIQRKWLGLGALFAIIFIKKKYISLTLFNFLAKLTYIVVPIKQSRFEQINLNAPF